MLTSLYLDLIVNKEPTQVHFNFLPAAKEERRHLIPLESPLVQLAGVQVNGEPWPEWSVGDNSILLPPGKEHRIVATLESRGM